jgi:hypothetical protein
MEILAGLISLIVWIAEVIAIFQILSHTRRTAENIEEIRRLLEERWKN